MNRQVRQAAYVTFALFAMLFVNLNVLQVLRADELAQDDGNRRVLLREYAVRRGSIVAGSGVEQVEIAASEETQGDLRFRRRYPGGSTWAHVTGFHSFIFGRAQLERTYNELLSGAGPGGLVDNISELLQGREDQGDTVIATLDPAVQEAALQGLGGQTGAVVALDPRTGAVLALLSQPSYDPSPLASHDGAEVRAAWDALQADPERPMASRATAELFPPGSTFKVITTAAALEGGLPPDRTFEDPVEADLPQTTATIGNFGGGRCNGGAPITLERALEISCNTTFAQLALEIGADRLVAQAQAFGFNAEVPFDLPLAESVIPPQLDPPQLAQSAIGQRDVRATPMQMAMATAAIANGGVLMTPRLVTEVQDFAGRVVQQLPFEPYTPPGRPGPEAVSPATAATLTELMVNVVAQGTGTRAQVAGVAVAGKSGTAQNGEGQLPSVWFVAFAPAQDPQVAVAVVVARSDVGDEATGGRVAAPIARAVIEAALRPSPPDEQ